MTCTMCLTVEKMFDGLLRFSVPPLWKVRRLADEQATEVYRAANR